MRWLEAGAPAQGQQRVVFPEAANSLLVTAEIVPGGIYLLGFPSDEGNFRVEIDAIFIQVDEKASA